MRSWLRVSADGKQVYLEGTPVYLEGTPVYLEGTPVCSWLRVSADGEQVLVVLVNEYEDLSKNRQMVLSGKARAALVYSCFRALDDFHRDFRDFGGAQVCILLLI